MKRSDFLKKLGIGVGVAVVAPRVFATENKVKSLGNGWYRREFRLSKGTDSGYTKYMINDVVFNIRDKKLYMIVETPFLGPLDYILRPLAITTNKGMNLEVSYEYMKENCLPQYRVFNPANNRGYIA